MGLGVGQEDRRAVDGGAGAEDEGLHAVALHHLQGVDQAADVVGVVGQRLLGRFAHRLEGREVHHRVDAVLAEDGVHGRGVADIGLLEHHRPAAQGLDAAQHLGRAVGEVVDAHDVKARRLQREPGVGGDVAGRAGQQDLGHLGSVQCEPAVCRGQGPAASSARGIQLST
jgi:hypothetical protein